ncbi:MAG: ABC transporter substrate-binding protein [Deltaproteobacteria bacterium]|jgi:putative ABC transport system substrate-binding protein|nr:ABC transporter substrate-binding protein [Deltaproteobacteria bacterium]
MARILTHRKIFLTLFVLFTFQHTGALAGDILVVQSARFPVYNDALQGLETVILRDVPARGLKAILPHTISNRILSEANNPQDLKQEIIRQRPDLIVVIGSSSLSLVKDIREIPIIYLLVPKPESIIGSRAKVTGIKMHITAGQQLNSLILMVPETRRIGLIYDPENTGTLVKYAEEFAKRRNISIVSRPVNTSREVPAQLAGLKGKIDWYWMVPDQTVITPDTLDHIFLFSLENRIPILTFAEKYLKLGAVLSVSFDAEDMGKQAGEQALQILNGTKVSDLPPVQARKVNIRVNQMAAETLGVKIRE